MDAEPPITQASRRIRESKDPGAPYRPIKEEVEQLFTEAESIRRMFDKSFSELPIMQQLMDLWESRGLSKDDPAIVLIQTLGLYDERQKALLRQLSGVIDATNRTHLVTTRGVSARIEEMARLEKSLRAGLVHVSAMNRGWEEMEQYFRSFRENVPYMIDQILSATRTINDKTIVGMIFNWLTPTLALIGGLVLGFYFGG